MNPASRDERDYAVGVLIEVLTAAVVDGQSATFGSARTELGVSAPRAQDVTSADSGTLGTGR
jgi:hypothetical protein